jgi:NhaA family Na+:H+ antiporter
MILYAPWEKAFKRVYTPFEHFLHAQTTTGLILIGTTIIALFLANSPLYEAYQHIIHTKIEFDIGSLQIKNPSKKKGFNSCGDRT